MPGYRVLWSVGLALGLSGCAATGQSRVAESPGREGLTAKLFAWRHRQAGEPVKKVGAKPEKGPEPTTVPARVWTENSGCIRSEAPSRWTTLSS